MPVVGLALMPTQAQQTYRLIHRGGQFKFSKDGSVFGNRERLLTADARGYYREYAVQTPGECDRGARRIFCGVGQPRGSETCYYTGDHYASFSRIVH